MTITLEGAGMIPTEAKETGSQATVATDRGRNPPIPPSNARTASPSCTSTPPPATRLGNPKGCPLTLASRQTPLSDGFEEDYAGGD